MSRRLVPLVLLVLVLSVIATGAVAAADDTKQVGLVIAFPDGTLHSEAVTVPAAATTFEVLKAAKIVLASETTSFGPAVCGINNIGCPATNCFCDAQHFWAYYHLENGAWVAAAEGAGSYVPANGAVEGFAWSGMDASFNPTVKPAVYTFDQIATAPQPAALPQTGGNLVAPALAGLLLAVVGFGMKTRQGKLL